MADSPEQNKLERVLHRFVDSNYKSGSSDDIYMEKLLTHLSGNDSNGDSNCSYASLNDDTDSSPFIYISGSSSSLMDLPVCKEWIQEVVEMWKNKSPEPSLASFALHFIGLFVGDWKRFELLQVTDVVGQVNRLLKHQNCDNSSVKQAYVRMLSGLLKHDSGCKWIVQTGKTSTLMSCILSVSCFGVCRCCCHISHIHYSRGGHNTAHREF